MENPGDWELLRQRDDQLQQLHERWDELVRIMEQKSSEVNITTLNSATSVFVYSCLDSNL